MAIAAVAAAPAAAITDARGSTTLPAADTPGVLVRPSRSTTTKPSASTSTPKSGEQAAGVGDVAGADEHRRSRDDPSVGECYPRQPVVVDDEPDDFAVDDANPARIELRPFVRGHVGRVREEHDVIGPLPDELGVHHRTGVGAEHPERLIADLPAVAVRAVQEIAAPAFAHTGDGGQVVGDAGRHEDAAGRHRVTARKMHDEPGLDLHHCVVDDLDAVSGDLFAAGGEELRGRHPVAGEEPLHVGGGSVAGCTGVDDGDRAPRPSEDERGAQAGCTTTDDHDVVVVLLHGGHAASAGLATGASAATAGTLDALDDHVHADRELPRRDRQRRASNAVDEVCANPPNIVTSWRRPAAAHPRVPSAG